MRETIDKLEGLLIDLQDYIATSSEAELSHKASVEKWSKKEILGHLADSAVNNLQRFVEIQLEEEPYRVRQYDRDELVKINDYQNTKIKEITDFLVSINMRIKSVINLQTSESLDRKIELYDGTMSDLRFLIDDYVEHFEHHVNQILDTRNT